MPRQNKPLLARRDASQQIDLFAEGKQKMAGSMPVWSTLPADIQVSLTELMTRLILEHADKYRTSSMTEAGHDL